MSVSQYNVLTNTLVRVLSVCEHVRTVLAGVCTVCVHSGGRQIPRLKPESLCAHLHDHLTGHANFIFKGTLRFSNSPLRCVVFFLH